MAEPGKEMEDKDKPFMVDSSVVECGEDKDTFTFDSTQSTKEIMIGFFSKPTMRLRLFVIFIPVIFLMF